MKRHSAHINEKKNYKTYIDGSTKDVLKFSLERLVETYFHGINETTYADEIKGDPF